jgi:hypothetical protein
VRRKFLLPLTALVSVLFVFLGTSAARADTTEKYCTSGGNFTVCVGWNYTNPHAYALYYNNNSYGASSHLVLNNNSSWTVTRNTSLLGHTMQSQEKWGVPRSRLCASLYIPPTNYITPWLICHNF